jgi:predicted nucleic-acid-binding protein
VTAIDSNVLLRYLLQDDPAQSPAANAVFAERTREDPVVIGLIVLVEAWWVMRGKKVPTPTRVAVHEALLSAVDVVVHQPDLVRQALAAVRVGADFPDAPITAVYRDRCQGSPVTFDEPAVSHAGMPAVDVAGPLPQPPR